MGKKKKHRSVQAALKPEKTILPGNAVLPYIIIFSFAFLLYSNTLSHGFVMDDGAMITTHETVKKGFAGIKELFGQSSVYGSTKENFGTYRPLTMSLFAMEYSFFMENSAAYHFVHVLLYSILCVVIFILLKKLFQSFSFGNGLAFISTLLFTAHPIHTEVAANVKSADEILSLLFCSLALLAGIRYAETSKIKFSAISFFVFLCGLFSKENSATFLLIILLALFLFSEASRKQILLLFSLHAFALVIYFLLRNAALDPSPPIGLVNNSLAGAADFSTRYGTAFFILLKYLGILFFPHPLCWDYGFNQIPLVGFANPVVIASLVIYLAMAVYAIIFLIKKSSQRTLVASLVSFCILFYLISLSVSSNIFVLIGTTMAERLLFTPSLAFCVLVSFVVVKVFRTNPFNVNLNILPLILILALYSYKTFSRNRDWESNITLFAKGVEDCPNSYRTNSTFAWESVLAGEKETDKEKRKVHFRNAITYYKKALTIYAGIEADWYNYGVSNSNVGNIDEAVAAYQRALQINPSHRNSNYNLATVYLSRKDFQNALNHFLKVYEIEPGFMDVSFKIGLIHHMGGQPHAAIPYYELYYKINPNNRDVINNLMMAYNSVGDKEKANELAGRLEQFQHK